MGEKKYKAFIVKIGNEYLGIKEDENGNLPKDVPTVDKVIGTLSKIEKLVEDYNSKNKDPKEQKSFPCDKII